MSNKGTEKNQENMEAPARGDETGELSASRRRSIFSRRNALVSVVSILLIVIFLFVIVALLYRNGFFDTYTKNQFRAKMADIGVVF